MLNMSQTSLNFYLHQQVFTCWNGLTGFFSSLKFFFFSQAWLNRFCFLMEVLFSAKPTWSSNRGGEWHRPRILTAWKQVIGSGNRTLDPQKDHAARSGNRTLDQQKRSCARPGVRTLDRLKRSFVQSCTRLLNTIARTIVKINAHTKICADARTSSTWNMSGGRRTTARPTDDGQTDWNQMMDRPFKKWCISQKKICSLQNIFFLRYHIMYQFM